MSATVVGVHLADDPAAWSAAGFVVVDDTVTVGSVQISLGPIAAGPSAMPAWTLLHRDDDPPGPPTIDGIPTRWLARWAGDPVAAGPDHPADHPNGCRALDHVVVATPDLDRTVRAFDEVGMRVRGERVAGTPNRPMRQAFLRDGAVIIEIVGPAVPDDDAEVRSRPATLWGLAFTSDDLDGAAALLGAKLGPVRDAVQPGRRIASLRHRDLGLSLPIAVMTR